MNRFSEETLLDVITPFQVLSGYALIEGDVSLLILSGGLWPGLAALPDWIDPLISPLSVRIVGQIKTLGNGHPCHGGPLELFELAVAGLITQALDRVSSADAVKALPKALQREKPLTHREAAQVLDVSYETASRGAKGSP